MPRKSDIPLKKHTLNLREGDAEVINTYFKQPYQAVIRRLVIHFVDKIRVRSDATNVDIDLSELEKD